MAKLNNYNQQEAVVACPGTIVVPGYPSVGFAIRAGQVQTK
jgi:hypothetical protein